MCCWVPKFSKYNVIITHQVVLFLKLKKDRKRKVIVGRKIYYSDMPGCTVMLLQKLVYSKKVLILSYNLLL